MTTPQQPPQPQPQPGPQGLQTPPAPQPDQRVASVSAQPSQVQQNPPQQNAANQNATKVKKDRTPWKMFIFGFAGALVACALCIGGALVYLTGGLSFSPENPLYTIEETNSGIVINANTDDMTLAEAVAAKTLPSVVNINVYSQAAQGFSPFGTQSSQTLEQTSLGSGVVLTADGYILTNNHVVDGAAALEVVAEGESYSAKVVGTDPSSDIAVVKVDGATLKPIEVGSSSELVVGEWVMAAGSPFGMEQSVSTGIVSALNRSYADEETGAIYTNMIQTDAAINSGNSGGALVNAEGKLIGINTLIISPSGGNTGVGFAIPIDYAFGIAEQIIQGKAPSHAQMGISMMTVNEQLASRFGLSTDEGAYVNSVAADGAAAKAGIQEGDVIVKVNGEAIESSSDLVLAIRSYNPGDTVKVTYIRDGKESTVDVTLGSDT